MFGKLRTIATIFLAVMIVSPNVIIAAPNGAQSHSEDIQKNIIERAENIAKSKEYQDLFTKPDIDKETDVRNEAEDKNTEVRIIVELDSEPGLVYANQNQLTLEKAMGKIEKSLIKEQKNVQTSISKAGVKMAYLANYTASFNGFSGKVKAFEIEKIEKLKGVKNVYISDEYERPEPLMTDSHGLIGSSETWDIGYKGEGMVVAVIDSGFDVSHKDFILSEDTLPALNKENIKTSKLDGKYYTEKVPYGYNYYDENNIIKETLGASHGMHVAGTVVANGEIKGVAPEAQVLAMRVFSNDPLYATTFADIYIKAIDDAIKLGANVLNMSLGSPAGFHKENSAVDVAISNAVENGVVAAVAAGNDRNIVYGHNSKALAENPDVGLVASPGLAEGTVAVASIDNMDELANVYLTYSIDGAEKEAAFEMATDSPSPKSLPENSEYVYAGLGKAEDFAKLGESVSGKIALIERGELDFTEKRSNAEKAGATAVIIYNHVSGGEELVSMAGGEDAKVPYLFIGNKAGSELASQVDAGTTISFSKREGKESGPKISEFSSWGVTPDLRLKPEISAPGGNIYSTQNNDGYGTMSGTSMATPHLAGGAALVQQYLKNHEEFSSLSVGERTELAKVLLMNSAYIINDDLDNVYSPRMQGAGVMNLVDAVESTVTVVDKLSKEAKVELKELKNKEFDLNVTVTNFGDKEMDYNIETIVLADQVKDGFLMETSKNVKHQSTGTESFTIKPGQQKELTVSIDFEKDNLPLNSFIEGFLVLTGSDEIELSVPFVGFYGDWGAPKVLDNFIVNDPDGPTFFNFAGMMGIGEMWFPGMPYPFPEYFFYDTSRMDMNPGAPIAQVAGTGVVVPHLSILRNAERMEFNILDENKKVVRTIGSEENMKKINRLKYGSPRANTIGTGLWDGMINKEPAKEGHYFYEIKSTLNYPGVKPQSKLMPILVDKTAPEISNVKLDKKTNLLTWDASDKGYPSEGVGVSRFTISSTLEESENELTLARKGEETTFSLDVSKLMEKDPENIYIWGYDELLNSDVYTLKVEEIPTENGDPHILLFDPGLLGFYGEKVQVNGYVIGFEALDKVLLGTEEVEADIRYLESITVNLGNSTYEGPAFEFTKELTLEDGYHELNVKAVAKDGSEDSIIRRFYVDTTAPELTHSVKDRSLDSDKATIEFVMKDNFPFFKLTEKGNELYKFNGFEDSIIGGPDEKTFEHEVPLKVGKNTFTFELSDVINQTVELTVDIYRGTDEELSKSYYGKDRYETAVKISESQYESADTVLLASGVNFPDALAGGPLASVIDAPLLLTGEKNIPEIVLDEIKRLDAKKVIILGGENSISKKVQEAITKNGLSVQRIAGANRYETAALIGEEVKAVTGSSEVFLANGSNFADALAISSVAGRDGIPILLTQKDVLTKETSEIIKQWKVKDITVIGGEAVIGSEALLNIIGWGANINRIYGEDRFETALAVAREFYEDSQTVVFTNGMDFPDALSGAPLASRNQAPVILTRSNVLEKPIGPYLKESQLEEVIFLGGKNALNDNVRIQILDILKK